MLTIWGSKHRFCDGIRRRDFLHHTDEATIVGSKRRDD
jgi:hypothetical protein